MVELATLQVLLQLNIIYLSNALEPLLRLNGSDFQTSEKLLLYGLTDVVWPFKTV